MVDRVAAGPSRHHCRGGVRHENTRIAHRRAPQLVAGLMGQAHALINVFIVGWPVIVGLPLAFAIGTAAVNPVGSARLALGLYALGFSLFLVAKISVLRSGRLVSFGSRPMRPPYRALYRTGYALMVAGLLFAVGLLLVTARPH